MHPKVLPRYINRSPRRHHLVCLSKLLEATIRQDTGKTTQVENLARRVSATHPNKKNSDGGILVRQYNG